MLRHWNLHKIRPSRNSESPPGGPDVLFFLPQLQGTRGYKTIVPSDEIEIAKDVRAVLSILIQPTQAAVKSLST